MHRSTVPTAAATVGLAAVAALGVAAPAIAGAGVTRSSAELVRWSTDPELLPHAAQARVQYVSQPDGRTRVTLHVKGLKPGHTYGAHAHVAACSLSKGGGHFQKQGSAVNAANEIWLDVTVNADGNGHSTAVQDWAIEPGQGPKSVIIHAQPTDVTTGLAGPRLACLDAAV